MFNALIDKLERQTALTKAEYIALLENRAACRDYLQQTACRVRQKIYGNDIYIRGLIEISSYCKNDCYYCGIRKSNGNAERYRLTPEQILCCCQNGYRLGFRTFVLQGGEDGWFTDDRLVSLIKKIKRTYPDCAVTLSLGERSLQSYKALREAGADRYLLRHETANQKHYESLHPRAMSYENRIQCLQNLKALGYQTGAGFMVGSPGQTLETIAEDILFVKALQPHMVGIGPFIPHKDTPLGQAPAGSAELTVFVLSLLRLTLPRVLLPATTALGTADPMGREKGILAGANVVMPNLSPVDVRKKYMLYDNKICTGDEAAQCIGCMQRRMQRIGCRIVTDRGDYKQEQEGEEP